MFSPPWWITLVQSSTCFITLQSVIQKPAPDTLHNNLISRFIHGLNGAPVFGDVLAKPESVLFSLTWSTEQAKNELVVEGAVYCAYLHFKRESYPDLPTKASWILPRENPAGIWKTFMSRKGLYVSIIAHLYFITAHTHQQERTGSTLHCTAKNKHVTLSICVDLTATDGTWLIALMFKETSSGNRRVDFAPEERFGTEG